MKKEIKNKIFAAALAGLLLSACAEEKSEPASAPVPAETTPSVTQSVTEAAAEDETDVSDTAEAEGTILSSETETEPGTEAETTLPPLDFEDTPDNAYERLIMAIDAEYGGEDPEDYGGCFSLFGVLYVNITTEEPSDFYKDIFADYTCVEINTVRYSLKELEEIGNKAAELLESDEQERFFITARYIDYPSNKAAIELFDKGGTTPKSAYDYLKTFPDLGFETGDLLITIEVQP